jgi:Fur family peroxide stress response transcriptional regulator
MKSQSSQVTEKLKQAEVVFRHQGMPLTLQRRAVLENLTSRTDHPTADAVFDTIRKTCPGVSRATVYRVLEACVALGMVKKISSTEAKSRYDADTCRHHHLSCSYCGTVVDIHDQSLDSLPLPSCAETGFTVTDYSISYTGICPACRSNMEPRLAAQDPEQQVILPARQPLP